MDTGENLKKGENEEWSPQWSDFGGAIVGKLRIWIEARTTLTLIALLGLGLTVGFGTPELRAAPPPAASEFPSLQIHVELSPAGSFTAESHSLVINGAARKGGNATIASISLSLDTLVSGIALRDEHMKRKYFEVQKHPIALMKDIIAQDGRFKAKLLIRRVEREIEGEYQLKGQGAVAKFRTSLSDFSIPEARYMGVGVEDEVEVEVTLPKL